MSDRTVSFLSRMDAQKGKDFCPVFLNITVQFLSLMITECYNIANHKPVGLTILICTVSNIGLEFKFDI